MVAVYRDCANQAAGGDISAHSLHGGRITRWFPLQASESAIPSERCSVELEDQRHRVAQGFAPSGLFYHKALEMFCVQLRKSWGEIF